MDPPGGVQAFKYEPLDPSKPQIRLISLLPQATTSWQTVIDCHVFHTSLEDKPSYEALSYVWGSESKPFMIRVNGKALAVTTNLFTALLHLRGSQARVFWIDAICIDQYSNSERNHQVSMMRSVFSQATRTSIWLGEIDFKVINGSANFVHHIQSDYESSLQGAVDKRPLLNPCDENAAENTRRILGSSWFHRIWVVQELACSKHVVVRVGHETMSWTALMRWVAIIDDGRKTNPREDTDAAQIASDEDSEEATCHLSEDGEEPQYSFDFARILIMDHQRTQYQEGARYDVLSLMFTLHDFEATVALDKVYALVGMAAQYDDSSMNLTIDYDLELDELLGRVIAQHTRYCLSDPRQIMLHESLDTAMSEASHNCHDNRCQHQRPFWKQWPLASPISRDDSIRVLPAMFTPPIPEILKTPRYKPAIGIWNFLMRAQA